MYNSQFEVREILIEELDAVVVGDGTGTGNGGHGQARFVKKRYRANRILPHLVEPDRCADYHCSHSVVISADRWSDDVRMSDIEPLFVCTACGHEGADLRAVFDDAPAPSHLNAEVDKKNWRH